MQDPQTCSLSSFPNFFPSTHPLFDHVCCWTCLLPRPLPPQVQVRGGTHRHRGSFLRKTFLSSPRQLTCFFFHWISLLLSVSLLFRTKSRPLARASWLRTRALG